jgi:hypothetical protein
MISSFDLNFDVLSDMLGIVVEKKNPAPSEGESLKLYIPTLMPNIIQTLPTKNQKFLNRGNKLFLNDITCRPVSKVLLNTQNYITGYLEKNTEWVNSKTSEIKNRELENSDKYKISIIGTDSYGGSISAKLYENYKTYYTVGGEKVECYAPNGKFSKLLFNNDKYI